MASKYEWSARCVIYRKEKWISVTFAKDDRLIARIKQIEGSWWSHDKRLWYVPDTPQNRVRFHLALAVELRIEHVRAIEKFGHWLHSKRYSESTIRVYADAVRSFFKFNLDIKLDEITENDVINYNNEYILKNQLSASYQNQVVNALKLFFVTVEKRVIDPTLIHRPRREKKLPNILSKIEVKRILESPLSFKQRAMLSMIYSCGFRRQEVLNLKKTDIDSDRLLVIVRQGKGKKDRIVPLSPKILSMLREYYIIYRPVTWLFEGQKAGDQYDAGSLRSAFQQALKRSGIAKPATLHWLRHSYANHLLETGTDLRFIQELLGHTSSRTTEIYTHVSLSGIRKIKSPFDDL